MATDPVDRFSGLAEIYARCRPDYPREAIDYLIERCALAPGDRVVDVGSGTGIFCRLLAARGLFVIGIEPNDDMRSKAEALQLSDKIEYRCGTGEQTGLPETFASAVTCAQAFHWLRADAALAEFQRILKPHGWAVLVWNERDESDAFTAAYGAVIRRFPDAAKVEGARQNAGQVMLGHPLFQSGEVVRFAHSQEMTEEQLVGRAFSASYAPTAAGERAQRADELRAVFARFHEAGRVVMRYTTSVYTACRR